ncbi:hypothetical protein KJ596_02960 [Patescibacteria group bacterium]|nr:hypothetical protein [Patescibacteria group bacterium]MBU1868273.1 hypothetical protein [Patescibacteria group bacterium]
MRISIRLNIICLFLILIPFLAYSRTAYKYYQRITSKTIITRGEIYLVFNGENWNEYNKKIIDKKTNAKDPYQISYEEVLRHQYSIDVENGNIYVVANKLEFLHYRDLAFYFLVLATLTWFYNQITFEKKELRLRIFTAWPTLFRNKAYRQILFGQKIELADIQQFHIYPLTAKIKQEADFSRLNPFNRAVLTYLTPDSTDGRTTAISVNLLLFPNFKNIILKIVKRKPDTQLLFTGSDRQTYQLIIPKEPEDNSSEVS